MKTFKEYIDNSGDVVALTEKLITFGGKAYPKFGNVVIMAGGAGSGKGFVASNLIGIEGKTFDVDALKSLAIRSPKLNKIVKDEFGTNLDQLNLKKPEDVSELHRILGTELRLDKRYLDNFTSIIGQKRKPNMIFDVTMKDIRKLQTITDLAKRLGYDKKNIHVVWVLNHIEVALAQNAKRDRTVPEEILIQTHEGVSMTIHTLFKKADILSKYMDGDFWITANMKGVDSHMKFSGNAGKRLPAEPGKETGSHTKGGSYITDAKYWKVKEQGKSSKSIANFSDELVQKIKKYTPNIEVW